MVALKLEKFSDYVTVKEAAEFLGVSRDTLRRWDRKGKLIAFRHPFNKYRLYSKDDLKAIIKKIKTPGQGGEK